MAEYDGTTPGPLRCTWLVEKYDDNNELDEEKTHVCGRAATIMFRSRNPKQGPNQPRYLTYPRCPRHDTEAARARAGIDGMDILEVA